MHSPCQLTSTPQILRIRVSFSKQIHNAFPRGNDTHDLGLNVQQRTRLRDNKIFTRTGNTQKLLEIRRRQRQRVSFGQSCESAKCSLYNTTPTPVSSAAVNEWRRTDPTDIKPCIPRTRLFLNTNPDGDVVREQVSYNRVRRKWGARHAKGRQ